MLFTKCKKFILNEGMLNFMFMSEFKDSENKLMKFFSVSLSNVADLKCYGQRQQPISCDCDKL